MKAIGILGVVVAILLYGSNYIVTKRRDVADGFTFAWMMSCGILFTGFLVLPLTTEFSLLPLGVLGGSLFAIANFMVVPITKLIGLGLGFLLWSITNLLGGYIVGKAGLFGVVPEKTQNLSQEVMNISGITLASLSVIFFFFIKPTIDEGASNIYLNNEPQEDTPLKEPSFPTLLRKSGIRKAFLTDEEIHYITRASSQVTSKIKNTFHSTIKNPIIRRVLGIVMAILVGILYVGALIPFKVWIYDQRIGYKRFKTIQLDFAFSYFSGIWILSTIVYFGYTIIRKNKPEVVPALILPSIISGIVWALGTCGTFYALDTLGFTAGYAVVTVAPVIITSIWSVFAFREIRGMRNLLLLGASLLCVVLGMIFLLISAPDFKFPEPAMSYQ